MQAISIQCNKNLAIARPRRKCTKIWFQPADAIFAAAEARCCVGVVEHDVFVVQCCEGTFDDLDSLCIGCSHWSQCEPRFVYDKASIAQ
jgi:hypothetical protein